MVWGGSSHWKEMLYLDNQMQNPEKTTNYIPQSIFGRSKYQHVAFFVGFWEGQVARKKTRLEGI